MQPQQPHTSPAQVPAPTASAQPRSRTVIMAVALVIGLALGAGGVGAAWALSGDNSSSAESTPAGDARAACQALDGFDEAKYTQKGSAGEIAVNRYAAAGAFSASAAAGDAKYKPLAEAVRRSQDRHARVFEFDATVKKELDRARGICTDL
ncbi:hypothetical protein [Streptomyces sp. cg35]|uniref:hypothetical protein n=1 Tax=Streptomyces sp. cg35 TaxID=3421650 RepID=UPI003D185749